MGTRAEPKEALVQNIMATFGALPVSDHNEWTMACLGVIKLISDCETTFASCLVAIPSG